MASQSDEPIFGTSAADTISAGQGNDLIYGDGLSGPVPPLADGNVIFAGKGDDTVWAGFGPDSVEGGPGNDLIYGYGYSTAPIASFYRDQDGADTIQGGPGDDTIYGGGGRDVIDGGPGNDVIVPGADADTITGGPGSDTFVYGTTNGLRRVPPLDYDTAGDVILDFQDGVDKLDFTAFARRAPPTQIDFIGTGTATNPSHVQVGYHYADGNTVVDVLIPSGSPAHITLEGIHVLSASDLVLV